MTEESYGLANTGESAEVAAPNVNWRSATPLLRPKIGLIGAGGITEHHLRAYKAAGLEVVAIANPTREKAEARRDAFYPDADVYTDGRRILERDDVEIVDIATHPAPRVGLVEDAIAAGKHVLSQKPFVTDLGVGERLVRMADEKGVLLAVNQNGRWSPHYRYVDQAIRHGILGRISSIDVSQQWDHSWTVGTEFEKIRHLLLYDFGIHWFDFIQCFSGGARARRVYAAVESADYQKAKPPFLAQVVIEYPGLLVRISYNANVTFGQEDRMVVCGEKGTIRSYGESWNQHEVHLHTEEGYARAELEGDWLTHGFRGTMLELVSAIEEKRDPQNAARHNLDSLALCFAAMESADSGNPVVPGDVRKIDVG